uniref:Uncharacterized protein n=1 Tax=Mycena chlorophos TaxID=658473 RepID=A0ABQ0KZD7_MYCCL|nr:predicted protein [Mycena chlorophos]
MVPFSAVAFYGIFQAPAFAASQMLVLASVGASAGPGLVLLTATTVLCLTALSVLLGVLSVAGTAIVRRTLSQWHAFFSLLEACALDSLYIC